MSLVEIAFLTLFHACKKFAGLKIISENNFRGLRCNEVPGICRTNSLSKQGFDSGKHQNVFPHSTFIIMTDNKNLKEIFKIYTPTFLKELKNKNGSVAEQCSHLFTEQSGCAARPS